MTHDKCTINDPIGLHDQNGHNIQFKNRHSCTLTYGQPSCIHPCNVPEHNQQPTPIHGYSVDAVPDYDVTFAYINFRQKDFPVSDFQHGDGHTESQ